MTSNPFARALLVALVLCSAASAQVLNQGFFTNAGLSIPPSGTGGGACGSPTNTLTLDCVSDLPGIVTTDPAISVGGFVLDLQHTYVADLEITLSHCGVSVVLSDGIGLNTPSANLNGAYVFRDDVAVPFDAAPSVGGVVVPGQYRPDNSLDPFRGLPAGGIWTLTICDRAGGDVGTLNTVNSFIHRLAFVGSVTFAPPVSIPPVGTGGATGGCANPNNTRQVTINLTSNALVGEIAFDLQMSHTFAGDLLVTLAHNGVERRLFDGAGLGGADLGATYLFRERLAAPTSSNVSAGTLNSGFYGFAESMSPFHGVPSSGNWTITVCDRFGGDVGTLNNVTLYIGVASLQTLVSQPAAGGLQFNILGGSTPGNRYFKPVSLTAGNFPNGWFYGVDIGIAELVAMFDLFPAFPSIWGTFNSCVQEGFIFNGTFPAGLEIYQVALEFGPAFGPVLQRSLPLGYTVQ